MIQAKAIILAAGKGTRLHSEESETPKALRKVNGKPLIEYVLAGIDFIKPEDITIVVGAWGEKIMAHLGDRYHYRWQTEQKGTAHAALCAADVWPDFQGPVMVLYCDMPLLSHDTYARVLQEHVDCQSKNTLLGARMHPIPAFGRFIRDEQGHLIDIVEDSACTPEQKLIDEVNVGVQVLSGDVMWPCLRAVQNNNPKHEFYLTGVTSVMAALGYRQHAVVTPDTPEYWGVNTLDELKAVEQYLQSRA